MKSENLRAMIMFDLINALYHKDEIKDKEMFIADFCEILNKYVVSVEDTKN